MSELNTNNRLIKFFELRRDKNKNTHESDGDKVMSLFITAGYPDLESTADLVLGLEKNGADIIELGMPFSDPLADGPTIQFASNEAIRNGITMEGILSMVREVRKSSDIPILLMGYINPILKFGVESFCKKASDAGADGLIIPDVTLEESALITEPASANNLSLVYLVAPNTSSARMRKIDDVSNGFVYCVSVTGVTGAREGSEIAQSVQRFIDRVNENVTKNPKLIGFGIRSYEDARRISEFADGFIVGSALIDEIRKNYPQNGWKEEVYKFVKHLKFGNIN
ncbi:MAG: tryptophan synthase subunit alpha [Balneolaceae bacterium]